MFEPTEIRVTTVHPQAGATVAGGAAVVDVTSTNPIVNVALSVSQTYLVKTGDAVRKDQPLLTIQSPDADAAISAFLSALALWR